VKDYQGFVRRVRSALPSTRIVYVSIKPSPSRRAFMASARQVNTRVRSQVARDTLQTYADVFTPMLNAKGEPKPELFLPDSLHMNRSGYQLWRRILAPGVGPR
jgi:lysophospholipase L1-like esterase